MNPRTDQLESEIAERNERLEEIERGLHELMPVRAKTDEPIQFEDYTGAVGAEKHRQWDRLMTERERITLELRQKDKELYELTHPQKE